ncbi:hypothetical protein [Nocardioides bruguierae]|uniref:Uncharacterized protein n=1 Tax=Nocardioides bruguierae TaxID=2945102 RepID=A0A9X2IGM0_9ACTN|nr:hypothetical protein [Nocardioides bruguierae]MCM0622507.1 hypothetical protein [Nocardioides bruguierae]
MPAVTLVTIDDIAALADPAWNDPQRARAEVLLDGVLGWTGRNVPGLQGTVAPEIAAEAKSIIAEAILRAVSAGVSNVASEGIGPSTVSFVDRASKPTLTEADKAALRDLVPTRRPGRGRFGTIRTSPGYLPTGRRR